MKITSGAWLTLAAAAAYVWWLEWGQGSTSSTSSTSSKGSSPAAPATASAGGDYTGASFVDDGSQIIVSVAGEQFTRFRGSQRSAFLGYIQSGFPVYLATDQTLGAAGTLESLYPVSASGGNGIPTPPGNPDVTLEDFTDLAPYVLD